MSATLIAVAIIIAWAAGFLPTLRWQFNRKRPYTEPLSCRWHCSGDHSYLCYQQPGTLISSATEALGFAALAGLIWPAFWTAVGVRASLRKLATIGIRQTPEETAAKTARLERELGMKP